VDVARGEIVEAELDRLITKRHDRGYLALPCSAALQPGGGLT
jgi:hypothetical protein